MEKIDKKYLYAITPFVLFVLLYGMFAFVTLEPFFTQWSIMSRGCLMLFEVVGSGIIIAIIEDFY